MTAAVAALPVMGRRRECLQLKGTMRRSRRWWASRRAQRSRQREHALIWAREQQGLRQTASTRKGERYVLASLACAYLMSSVFPARALARALSRSSRGEKRERLSC